MNDDLKETIRNANPILEVISEHVKLQQSGQQYIGHCPFHDDSTPSFSVSPEKNVFHCFGCGTSGDVFTFVEKLKHLSFYDALTCLADRKHIPLRNQTPEEQKRAEEKHRREKILTEAVDFYHHQLFQEASKSAYEYLTLKRKLTDETLKRFKIGYSPGGNALINHLLEKGYTIEQVEKTGLLVKTQSGDLLERFKDRILFPNLLHHKVVHITARSLKDSVAPKYLHLPGKIEHLYNEQVLLSPSVSRLSPVFLTEGVLDCLLAEQHGFPAMATYGTQTFKEDFIQKLPASNSGLPMFFICFDSEENNAGLQGAWKVGLLLHFASIPVKIVDLPREENVPKVDLAEYLSTHTKEEFEALLSFAITLPEFKRKHKFPLDRSLLVSQDGLLIYRTGCYEYRVETIESQKEGNRCTLSVFKDSELLHKDNLPLYSAQRRKAFASCVSPHVEKHLLEIDEELDTYTKEKLKVLQADTQKQQEMTESEKQEALAFLKSPNLLSEIEKDIETLGLVGESANKVIAYLIATSRKLEKPLSAIVKAQSAAGKSHLAYTVFKLMPPEEIKDFTRLTPQALFYLDKNELSHKFVVIMESVGSEGAEYGLRVLQSEQKLKLAVPMRDPESGSTKTIEIEVDGPMALMETTTRPSLNFENETRCFNLYINESEEQTKKIQVAQKKARQIETLQIEKQREYVIQKHQNAQRLLQPLKVFIPYAHLIDFPTQWVRTRRDHDRFLDLITVIAFLHQYQREIKTTAEGVPYLEATFQDYQLAYDLSLDILGHTLDELNKTSRELLELIKDMLEKKLPFHGTDSIHEVEFTRKDIRLYTGWKEFTLRTYIKQLEDMEFLNVLSGGKGKITIYTFNANGDIRRTPVKNLTTPEQLKTHLTS